MKYNKLKLMRLLGENKKTQTEISKLTGVSINMIGRLERGDSLPSIDSLPKIAQILGKDMNYFFTENNSSTLETSEVIPDYGHEKNPWKLLFEKQEEITQLKAENEKLKTELKK